MNFSSSMQKLVLSVIPPPQWRLSVIILAGIITGLGFYILQISNAPSYLSDKPEACINCHVMNPEYATWLKSAHGRVTVCNDCHVPQNNNFRKYEFKASDGMRHSYMFTFRLEPQVIRISDAGKKAVQENCIRCHSELTEKMKYRNEKDEYCFTCHRETPHGRVKGLSSTPNAMLSIREPETTNWK